MSERGRIQAVCAITAFGAGCKALTAMHDHGTTKGRWVALIGVLAGIAGLVSRIVLWCLR